MPIRISRLHESSRHNPNVNFLEEKVHSVGQMKKIGSKYLNRYQCYKDKNDIFVYDSYLKKLVGNIQYRIGKDVKYPLIEFSFIRKEYRGVGIGKFMYATAINHFGGIVSDDQLTPCSGKVWKTLIKNGNVFYFDRFSTEDPVPVYWDSEENKPEIPNTNLNPFTAGGEFFAVRCRKSKSVY